MRRLSLVLFLLLFAMAAPAGAHASVSRSKVPSKHVTVTPNVHHDTSPPLRDISPSHTRSHVHPALRSQSQSTQGHVRARDTSGQHGRPKIPSPSVNFDGISASGFAPPDTQGAAGTTQYVAMDNVRIAVYSKTGAVIQAPVNTNTLWAGFTGGCEDDNDGDGFVLWDTMAQRWVLSQFAVEATPFLECVAVSTTSDATGTYNRYSFSYGTVFPDYPKMGVWPDAYYTSFNLFNSAGTVALGTELCAYNRAAMLAGTAATQQCFTPYTSGTQTQLPASLDGAIQPTAGENEYFVGLSTNANNLAYFKFHVDWVTPGNTSLTGPTDLAVNAFTLACTNGGTCIPQQSPGELLDSLGDRVMARLAYRNFGGHESLVVTHSINAGSSVGARWYELRVSGGNLTVFQQGTVAPDAAYRWMGSIAMDSSGDIALGYSVSSTTQHPAVAYTGRLVSDPLGTMPQGEATVITGAGSQTGTFNRWGDYSAMAVDPVDDCTFWYTNEYIPVTGAFNWHTRIASFKFQNCGTKGDFNGDGFADLAVGVPLEDVGSIQDAGAVNVIYGSAAGLDATAGPGNQFWSQDSTGILDQAETDDEFGGAVVVGDFNGDGFSDLAVGVPVEDVGSVADAGAINVIYGSAAGLTDVGNQFWSQDSTGILDVAEQADILGGTLSAGDLNGDGYEDLAAGVVLEDILGTTDAGEVNVIYGSAAGLTATGNQLWNQNSTNIADTAEAGDELGFSVAIGDFNANGFDDLAIGVPGEDVRSIGNAGAINVIYGSSSGLTDTGNQYWSQNTPSIMDSSEASDDFGWSLAAGDFNGDGNSDMGVGVPSEDVKSIADAGAINVLYGGSGGLSATGNQYWSQNTPSILDKSEANDLFGYSLASGDFNANGKDDLSVGVVTEKIKFTADGATNVLYGGTGGLSATSNQLWDQQSSFILDSSETGDQFGFAVGSGDFNGDGSVDLAVGVDLEDIGSIVDAGGANVIYGSPALLTSTGNQFWSQDSTGILDQAEDSDIFAGTVASGTAPSRPGAPR